MITHGQRHALSVLKDRHDRYPERMNFATAHLGANVVTLLRKLALAGLVTATKGGPGTRQFFAITAAGRAALAPPVPVSREGDA
jgi:DNA-binding PadR family transcriptional regulator